MSKLDAEKEHVTCFKLTLARFLRGARNVSVGIITPISECGDDDGAKNARMSGQTDRILERRQI